VDALVAEGLKLETFSVRDRDRALVGMRFDGLPTKYSHLLMLPQNVTERVLADRIGTLGGMVRRGVTATKIVQDGDGVRVTTIEGGQESIVAARYVIGADGMLVDLIWSSRFRIHHRIAKAYRNGRLLPMGDAAHVHSPAGGQGMNTGLIDAEILGQLLADAVKGRRPETALDIYRSVRRPAAEQVLALAGRLTGMATTRSPLMRFMRNLLFWFIDIDPIAKRRITMNLSGLARASLAQLPKRRRSCAIAHAQTTAARQTRPSVRQTASRIRA
jgi:2-polyprenyl-6-methoxyphenol hydroxylase-like FAD-dependent oxidoreductase